MKTELFVVSISPYFGKRIYRVAKLTKRQLVTEPLNETGARMRFYRPSVDDMKDGMPLTQFPRRGYDSSTHLLMIKHKE